MLTPHISLKEKLPLFPQINYTPKEKGIVPLATFSKMPWNILY